MKSGKKLLAVMMAAMFAAGTVAGCGSTGTKATQADQTTAKEETSKVEETTKAAETNEAKAEKEDLYVFIAASLKNTMEKIKETYEKDHPNVNIIYNADSSGTLQTQIEEGAQCDVFFSAATKQMDALKEGGFVVDGSISNLLENKIVLIKPKDGKTEVTGFDNITKASSLALAGEDVPVGQYARKLFTNLGTLDQVMKMEINEGANVTAVLTAVAEGSNEVGVVYATDAASMADKVEIIAEADNSMIDPAVYPVGLIIDKEASEGQVKAAADFKEYLVNDEGVMKLFTDAGFAKSTK
ncbi:molybdate ABC transporter substrate-binding protein [Clostridium sp. WB02_MRS01]|uniref:molybdate ABC transporter substrate-binding protein n=1 Tax=Clostridium sp. WB02_MRS01 TaxID=2605777 RepID=UPI0012B37698|nr:molybdate ABC transporter substrate-binding protein [Clostridium sp. WB02_MRS01]MSS09003.1 molybdate ABC transporter substrate-binding protein [Clostridium sp. WB02_MRS01]